MEVSAKAGIYHVYEWASWPNEKYPHYQIEYAERKLKRVCMFLICVFDCSYQLNYYKANNNETAKCKYADVSNLQYSLV